MIKIDKDIPLDSTPSPITERMEGLPLLDMDVGDSFYIPTLALTQGSSRTKTREQLDGIIEKVKTDPVYADYSARMFVVRRVDSQIPAFFGHRVWRMPDNYVEDKCGHNEDNLVPEYIYADTIISVESHYISDSNVDALLRVTKNVLKSDAWDEDHKQLDLQKLVDMRAVVEVDSVCVDTYADGGTRKNHPEDTPVLRALKALRAVDSKPD